MARDRFDQGDLKVLAPSPSAMRLADLLDHDLDYLKGMRAAATQFKWSQRRNLSQKGKTVLKAITKNRALSPTQREDNRNQIVREERQAAKEAWIRARAEAKHWIAMVRIFEGQVTAFDSMDEAAQREEAQELKRAYYLNDTAKLKKYADHEAREKAHDKQVKAQRRRDGLEQKRAAERKQQLFDETKPFGRGNVATFDYMRGYASGGSKRWPKVPESVLRPETHFKAVAEYYYERNRKDTGKVGQFKFAARDQLVQVTNGKPKLGSGD